jgi:NTP pyrophosphatase (non-canonical NTP hydrolase)
MSAHNFNLLAAEAHRIAVEHGFIDNTIGEDMALIHSEVSEALEDHRAGHKPTETWYEAKTSIESKTPIDKPCGIPSEMADVVIRVAHFCAKHGIDLDKAVAEKMEYNTTRPYKHGKVM